MKQNLYCAVDCAEDEIRKVYVGAEVSDIYIDHGCSILMSRNHWHCYLLGT